MHQQDAFVCPDNRRGVADVTGSRMTDDTHRHPHTIAVGNNATVAIGHDTTVITEGTLTERACCIAVPHDGVARRTYHQACPSSTYGMNIDIAVDHRSAHSDSD